jgi:hypothetical protein
MRAKLTLLSALAMGTLCGVLAAGCQTYDFEPVEPLALSQTTVETNIEVRSLKPNMMLLVDTSGSMTLPLDKNDQRCQTSRGTCGIDINCPSNCPTRWRALQGAMGSFLTASGKVARMGLATYPGKELVQNEVCGGASSLRITLPTAEDETSLSNKAAEVNAAIQAIPQFGTGQPEGGTPTASSLRYLGTLSDLQGDAREDFVLLLTDGLPNCNDAHPTPSPDPQCRCTLGTACNDVSSFKTLGCLDKDGSVAAVTALRAQNIRTIVIGFGAETATGDGTEVLNAMAEAGGFAIEPKSCTANADCGSGDTCDTTAGKCRRRFYQAGNQTELAAALDAITERVVTGNPCLVKLALDQIPSSESLLVVYLDGARLAASDTTWRLRTDQGVEFLGDKCTRIKNSTPADPAKIEIRSIQRR